MMEDNTIDAVITQLQAKGYTLTFNPEDSDAAAWGVSGPWPSDIEYEIEEEIRCKIFTDGEESSVRVLAVTTKPFGLKGIRIVSAEQQRYWTIGEVLDSFTKILKATKNFIFGMKL